MTRSVKSMVTLLAVLASSLASAESLMFTNSPVVSLPGSSVAGTPVGGNACSAQGICSSALRYNTTSGGQLTVTASDSVLTYSDALVFQSKDTNAGLGVVSGFKGLGGGFVIADLDYAVSGYNEALTLTFASDVAISAAYFFPDDRSTSAVLHELDAFDGFTVSVDNGDYVEYSFGSAGGHPVQFSTPLVGRIFTFGYASKKSPEHYYLAGLTFSTPAVPEASSIAMMAVGLLAVAGVARRRRA